MKAKSIERDCFFDTLKGFLIIAVIVGNTMELYSPTEMYIHSFILFLYIFHMPLFTFVSGYFSKKSKRTTVQKVKHTFGLYLLAQILYVFYSNIFLNSSLEISLLTTHWTFWYLLSLTCWYILSDYISNEKLWLIGSIIFSLLIGFDPSVNSAASFSRTFFFLPFFILGMMFKREYIETLRKKKFYLFLLSLVVIIILFIFEKQIPVDMLFEYTDYSTFISYGLAPLFVRAFHYIGAIILGAFILSLVPNKKTPFSFIGEISLYMYLFHGSIAHTFVFSLRYNNILNAILSSALIICICILLAKICLKIKPIIKAKNQELK